MNRMNTIPLVTLVIGDRLETDIVGAQKLGCLTGLVLTGVTDEASARAWIPQPNFITSDLGGLVSMINARRRNNDTYYEI